MKKLLFFLFALCIYNFSIAQAPSIVCYQGVATNTSGAELVSTDISIRASFLQGSTSGTSAYTETHDVKTDQFGLFNIDLGSKPTVGKKDLSQLDWAKGPYYLKIEMAVPKGGTFKDIGTTQLLSVPYALHSATSDTALVARTAYNDKDTDPKNELQGLAFDKATGKLKIVPASDPTAQADVTVQDADGDPKNELQTLKFDDKTGALSLYDVKNTKTSEVSTRSGLFSQPGASASFPQGIIGKYRFVKSGDIYTVPQGKTFYVTANGSQTTEIEIVSNLGDPLKIDSYHSCPIFPQGTVIKNSILTGFEVDANPMIEAVVIHLNKPYVIPVNKVLIITSGIPIGPNTLIVDISEYSSFLLPSNGTQFISLPGGANGMTIKPQIGLKPPIITGYLLDMP